MKTKLEEYSNIEADIRKRSLKFYGLIRLTDHTLTKRIIKYVFTYKRGRMDLKC